MGVTGKVTCMVRTSQVVNTRPEAPNANSRLPHYGRSERGRAALDQVCTFRASSGVARSFFLANKGRVRTICGGKGQVGWKNRARKPGAEIASLVMGANREEGKEKQAVWTVRLTGFWCPVLPRRMESYVVCLCCPRRRRSGLCERLLESAPHLTSPSPRAQGE
ncbi:hypothetical protein BD289DRAFT_131034 [Coniella lustricola]|uniref:Uncharacterized protein n=1 Tax=Coniella lustricola TaxID=2025994 RepID=A0A2T3AFL9_9PEZI|nr:hypothetical protein BD289DRAFT_131034 [Coniella lustricola]